MSTAAVRKWQRVLAAVCCAIVLAFVGSTLSASSAEAFSGDSWNMAAGSAAHNWYPQEVKANEVVIGQVLNGHPWSVALQEICEPRAYELMLNSAIATTYPLPHHTPVAISDGKCTRPDGVPEDQDIWRANLILAIGPRINAFYVALGPYDGQENRFMTCATHQNIGFPWVACSVHLSKSPTFAINQGTLAFNHVAGWGSLYSVIAGDYNQTPGQTHQIPSPPAGPTSLFHWTHSEAHNLNPACYTHSGAQHGNRKIDFIYAKRQHSTTIGGACSQRTFWSFSGLQISDHAYTWGFFSYS